MTRYLARIDPSAIGLFGLLILGVFVLPYFVPLSSAILSASALAGFNNSVAYAAYIFVSIPLAYVLARRITSTSALCSLEPARRLLVAPPAIVLIVSGCHAALFMWLYLQRDGFVFAEALYFQDAVYRVQAGASPFVDFNFFYGPLLLYPAVFLSKYLSVPAAYGVTYVLCYVAGLYLLYVVMAALFVRRWVAVAWFVLFAIGLFNPITGLNYTFGRFMLPAVTLLATWRWLSCRTVGTWLQAELLVVLAILCSPDIAAVTILTVGVLITATVWRATDQKRLGIALPIGVLVVALTVAFALLLLIDRTIEPIEAYFRPIVTFSGGGWSTPVDPSLPVLALVGLSVFFLTYTCAAWHRRDRDALPFLVAFAVMALLMQRASFGKADVLHVAYSGIPIYLAAATCVEGRRRSALVLATTLFICIAVPLQLYHALMFVPALGTAPPTAAAPGAATTVPAFPTKQEIQASISRAVEYFGPSRVYYMHRLEYYRLPIYLRYRLSPFLYHPSLTSTFTFADIQDVIGELRESGAIVLARRSDLIVAAAAQRLETRWWHYVTSSPLPGSTVYNLTLEFQASLETPLVQFLGSAYERQFEDGEIVGLVPRDRQHAISHALQ